MSNDSKAVEGGIHVALLSWSRSIVGRVQIGLVDFFATFVWSIQDAYSLLKPRVSSQESSLHRQCLKGILSYIKASNRVLTGI